MTTWRFSGVTPGLHTGANLSVTRASLEKPASTKYLFQRSSACHGEVERTAFLVLKILVSAVRLRRPWPPASRTPVSAAHSTPATAIPPLDTGKKCVSEMPSVNVALSGSSAGYARTVSGARADHCQPHSSSVPSQTRSNRSVGPNRRAELATLWAWRCQSAASENRSAGEKTHRVLSGTLTSHAAAILPRGWRGFETCSRTKSSLVEKAEESASAPLVVPRHAR